MYPEERVFVGVIGRKKDLKLAFAEHWYRIPEDRISHFHKTEYIAFFTKNAVIRDKEDPYRPGGIYYYAQITGIELVKRRDLLPTERDHPNADKLYYRVALSSIQHRETPILNPQNRVVTFIFTTGDRFLSAQTIADLYSEADHFVERLYHKLGPQNIFIERVWEAQREPEVMMPAIRVSRNRDVWDQSAKAREITMSLNDGDEDQILAAIRAEIEQMQGPVLINLPFIHHLH